MPIRHRLLIGVWCLTPLSVHAQVSSRHVERVDSLILERTACLGTCPAYRLAAHSSGLVRFESRNRDAAGHTEMDSVGARAFARMVREISRVKFFDLPAIEVGKAPYCRVVMTDAPSISVAVFGSSKSRVLRYDTGCQGEGSHRRTTRSAIMRLGNLADSLDAITRATRWIRPSPCCGGI